MSDDWPAASYERWGGTCDTLHAHTQVLGKLAVQLAPPGPQLQHAALRLTARGWETAPLPGPDGSGSLVVVLDLRLHEAVVEHSSGQTHQVALTPDRPVAEVTAEVLAAVWAGLECSVHGGGLAEGGHSESDWGGGAGAPGDLGELAFGASEAHRGPVGLNLVRCPSGRSEGCLVGGDPVDQGSEQHLASAWLVRPSCRKVG